MLIDPQSENLSVQHCSRFQCFHVDLVVVRLEEARWQRTGIRSVWFACSRRQQVHEDAVAMTCCLLILSLSAFLSSFPNGMFAVLSVVQKGLVP